MLPKLLSSFLSGVGVVLLVGAALAPVAQTDLTTDQQLQLTLASVIQVNRDQDAEIAALYATIDAPNIATAVSTITQSETPHVSPTRTPSPSATRTPVIAAPTVTNTPQGAAPTPTLDEVPMEPTDEIGTPAPTNTFVAGTNTYTPTRTPVIGAPTVIPAVTELPEMTYALNIGSVDRNVRSCPDLSCEVVAVVRVGETVVINLEQTIISQNYRWYALWNSDFNSPAWVTSERMDPYLRYLSWE